MAVKGKGTLKTEVLIGTAAANLDKAIKAILEGTSTLSKLTEEVESNARRIEDQESKLLDLDQQIKNKAAQQEVDLSLLFQQSETNFVNKYLSANSLQAVKVTDYEKLVNELTTTKAEFDNNLKSQLGREKGILEAGYNRDLKTKELEYQAKEAENIAKIKSLEEKVSYLQQQIEDWKNQLDAERRASVERAKASAVGTLNVNSGK